MSDRTDRCFWTIAIGVALIAVGTIYGSGGPPPAQEAPRAHTPAPASVPLVTSSFVSSTPQVRRPAVIATVFECRRSGQHVFSDERCGSDAHVRAIQYPSRMDAQDTSILREPLPAASAESRTSVTATVADVSQECSGIEHEKDAINAHMREGYGSAEGENLRERLRELSSRYYELGCRHTR